MSTARLHLAGGVLLGETGLPWLMPTRMVPVRGEVGATAETGDMVGWL
jgi:hypothetical protein